MTGFFLYFEFMFMWISVKRSASQPFSLYVRENLAPKYHVGISVFSLFPHTLNSFVFIEVNWPQVRNKKEVGILIWIFYKDE